MSTCPHLTHTPHRPFLLFFYGGGLTHGARIYPHQPLVHANFGAFFAMRGIITVIVDYRLVPGIFFPDGSQDVHDALAWVSQNLNEVGDTERIFLMGHSAGGIHLAGYLLNQSVYSQSIPVCGCIILGVPYEIPVGNKTAARIRETAELYYGGAKKVAMNQPLGLLRRAENVEALPPLRNMMAEKEPRYISSAVKTFGKLYASKGGEVDTIILNGHDHLSPIMSLCSGEKEEWGIDIANWIHIDRN
ncbi:alpha/beta-hydrolase [Cylindrobasidium torrendii FP15055 ss-10]|uniref:Alpha/beta-hydrolase n=1 Tax=Cylindrobasidium torrendii FP15055 ss-10 TaxID=1314674 RepID=A0A0D7BGN7_9AGAR|nr:alpha/beta-hydrolase [Cylindrobasidium torrendii FP15055 ss-10]